MELKPGYKQTEVGVIPEEWDVVPLGSYFDFKNGLNKPKRFFGSGTPIVNYMDVFQRTSLRVQDVLGQVSVDSGEIRAYDVRKGDVLFTRTSETVEEIGVGSVMLDEPVNTVFSGFVLRARPKDKSLDDCFKAYCFASHSFRRQVVARASYTTRALTNGRSLSAALLARPPLHEQSAIADALSDVDALLDGLDRLIAKKRDLKQAAVQQLLTGQTRLPGFGGTWKVRRLRDLLRFQVGFPFSSAYFNGSGEGIRLVRNRDLKNDDQVSHYCGQYDSSFIVHNGDVLVGMDGDFLPCEWNKGLALLNQRVGRIIPKSGLLARFAFYALMEPLKEVQATTSGTTVKHLSHGDVEGIERALPEVIEQTAIVTVLSDIDAELAALEARRDKTRLLKHAMMQELLTGRTRLVDIRADTVSVEDSPRLEAIPVQQQARKFHNWQINEAVVVSVLVKHFGSEQYPLGRKRCTKLAYLVHRHVERAAEGYRKKAAGPYNPDVKYRGPEGIAQKNGYIRPHSNGKFSGFVAAENIAKAETYFDQWYGRDVIAWLEQFRHKTNDELELLATVDMAVEDLRRAGQRAAVEAVKSVLRDHPEWQAKLDRAVFSDTNIARTIREVEALFP